MNRRSEIPQTFPGSSSSYRVGPGIFALSIFFLCWTGSASAQSAEPTWCKVCESPVGFHAGPAQLEPLGAKKVLFYRLRFPGDTNDLLSGTEIDWAMQNANETFLRISYGQFQLQWTVTPSLMLPHSPEWYGPNGHESLATDARALALSAGLNWQEFDYDIFLHRRLPGTFYSGAGNNRGRGVWLVEAGSRRATSTSHWCFRYPLT